MASAVTTAKVNNQNHCKEDTALDLKKKNESLSKEVERLTALVSKSERKRRKQKIVYEKNMENLSIRLVDFESNLRKEQKEIQDLISKKEQQIKVREELVKTLRDKLTQQFCNQCGCANPKVDSMDVDWELDIDEDKNEVIKKLPPLDLPPPEESKQISFTNHRPFRPKSKLSPVAEESEISFGSSLRDIHADLTPDRFHAALTASLGSLLDNVEDGVETPTNSIGGGSNEDNSNAEEKSPEDQCDINEANIEETVSVLTPAFEQVVVKEKVASPSNGLFTFSDRLSSNILSLVNQNLAQKKTKRIDSPPNKGKENISNIQNFCANIVTKNLLEAMNEISASKQKECVISSSTRERTPTVDPSSDKMKRLHTAAVSFVDQFISNDFMSESLSQRSLSPRRVPPMSSDEIPDEISQEDSILTGNEKQRELFDHARLDTDMNPNNSTLVTEPTLDDDKCVVIREEEPTEIVSIETNEKRTSFNDNDQELSEKRISNVEASDQRIPDDENETTDEQRLPTEPNDNRTSTEELNGHLKSDEPSEKQIPDNQITEQQIQDEQQQSMEPANGEIENEHQPADDTSDHKRTNNENSPPNDASPDSTKSKKKKKKKKKKRKSVSNESDESFVSATGENTQDTSADQPVMERMKLPVEDKFSLTLDDQLDLLGESPTSPTHSTLGEQLSQTTKM
uniref:Uncharacterized protein n=1 Tax=Clytia hemisphaerica TaxID=252671 RepID=A0A7M5X9B6_9CNID